VGVRPASIEGRCSIPVRLCCAEEEGAWVRRRPPCPAPAEMWSATRHCTTERPGLTITTSMLCMAPGIMLQEDSKTREE
jgi:hypothetical protein